MGDGALVAAGNNLFHLNPDLIYQSPSTFPATPQSQTSDPEHVGDGPRIIARNTVDAARRPAPRPPPAAARHRGRPPRRTFLPPEPLISTDLLDSLLNNDTTTAYTLYHHFTE